MTVKIAHISDLHWEHCDQAVLDRLIRALRKEGPRIIAFTGDLVDNPWSIKKAKTWLMDLCKACDIDSATQLLVIPGNHDYRIYGNLGFRPITGWLFRRNFKSWLSKRIVPFPDLGVTFFLVDSNPLMFGFARGKVGRGQLRKLRGDLRAMTTAQRVQVEGSVRIIMVHHHPVPIPYEGADPFLLLSDAHYLMQFVAENRIDIVLHGHKHRAPYSMISLGTCGGNDRVIEVLGAGAAVIGTPDHDPRGHNFNLVCIEPFGLRYVRQFFAHPGEDFREAPNPAFPAQSFEMAYQRAVARERAREDKAGHRYDSIHWDLDIDFEGDRFNEISYTGLRALDATQLSSIKLPAYELDTGHLSDVWLNPKKTSSDVSLNVLHQEPRRTEFEVRFANILTDERAIDFSIQSVDFNASSLNLSEFRKKYPGRALRREWEEKAIQVPVNHFSWTLHFPPDLEFEQDRLPEFEVRSVEDNEKHEWLTEILQSNFFYSEVLHTAFLRVRRPPTGYRFRIYWHIPPGAATLAPTPAKEILLARQFARTLLILSRSARTSACLPPKYAEVINVLKAFGHLVAQRIEQEVGKSGLVKIDELDISLMVYDDAEKSESPRLRIVALIGSPTPAFWDFSLEVGDGNAGRSYRKNIVRVFDVEKKDPKHNTYVQIPGVDQHRVLYSIPLRSPSSQELIYGILNLGSLFDLQSSLLRLLDTQKGVLWLLEQVQGYLLPRLQELL
jgi:predicted MPP superfamily phosphohydrolase